MSLGWPQTWVAVKQGSSDKRKQRTQGRELRVARCLEENTCFFFESSTDALPEALQRFSSFFKTPLLAAALALDWQVEGHGQTDQHLWTYRGMLQMSLIPPGATGLSCCSRWKLMTKARHDMIELLNQSVWKGGFDAVFVRADLV